MKSVLATVRLDDLKVGGVLRSPIYDESEQRDVLLLSAGTLITEPLVERLKQRGIQQVRLCWKEFERLNGKTSRQASSSKYDRDRLRSITALATQRDADCPTAEKKAIKLNANSFVHQVRDWGTKSYSQENVHEFNETYEFAVSQMESIYTGLLRREPNHSAVVCELSVNALKQISEDLDLYASLGLASAEDNYLYRHSAQTAMMAMSIGTMLGLNQDDLIDLGIGCLIHDAGMMQVDPELLESPARLSRIEFLEITKHPSVTYDLIKDSPEIPHISRMVAYQIHERCDGSGYPRQRTCYQIHPMSKIAAVADSFVAMVSPRPYRPAMLHYQAMMQILKQTHKGKFDPNVVRALLHTISLFPLGSFVELSDGRIGKILRANGSDYISPIVEIQETGDTQLRPAEVIDLSTEAELSVERSLLSPEQAEAAMLMIAS